MDNLAAAHRSNDGEILEGENTDKVFPEAGKEVGVRQPEKALWLTAEQKPGELEGDGHRQIKEENEMYGSFANNQSRVKKGKMRSSLIRYCTEIRKETLLIEDRWLLWAVHS